MVYYNLHKHTFSVQKNGLVILHADYLKLKNVEFRVRQRGNERVRDEKSKNVHAFVIGDLIDYCQYPCDEMPEEAMVDPDYEISLEVQCRLRIYELVGRRLQRSFSNRIGKLPSEISIILFIFHFFTSNFSP